MLTKTFFQVLENACFSTQDLDILARCTQPFLTSYKNSTSSSSISLGIKYSDQKEGEGRVGQSEPRDRTGGDIADQPRDKRGDKGGGGDIVVPSEPRKRGEDAGGDINDQPRDRIGDAGGDIVVRSDEKERDDTDDRVGQLSEELGVRSEGRGFANEVKICDSISKTSSVSVASTVINSGSELELVSGTDSGTGRVSETVSRSSSSSNKGSSSDSHLSVRTKFSGSIGTTIELDSVFSTLNAREMVAEKAISIEPDRLRVKEPAILSNILEEKKTKINEDARAKKTTTKTPCSKSTQTQYFCLLF